MVRACVHAKELAIYQNRNPRQRKPIAHIRVGKGPSDTAPGKPFLDMKIFREEIRIVKGDKTVMKDLAIDQNHERGKDQTKA